MDSSLAVEGPKVEVPKLLNMTLKVIVKNIWISKLSHTMSSMACWNHKTAEDLLWVDNQHYQLLKQMELDLNSSMPLPNNWIQQIYRMVCDLDLRVMDWAQELVSYLESGSKENVRICCENVHIDPQGNINKQKSILSVLSKSSFTIRFHPVMFKYYAITDNLICPLFDSVMNKNEVLLEHQKRNQNWFFNKRFRRCTVNS